MNTAGAEALLILVIVCLVFLFPALCLSRIAGRLGKSPLRYGLLSLVPLGSLVALGVLAFSSAPPSAPQGRRS